MKMKFIIPAVLGTALFCSCQESGSGDNVGQNETEPEVVEDTLSGDAKGLIEALFSNIPSPMTLSFIMRDAGINYVEKLPHDPEKVSSYVDMKKMSINLGIYGTDLTYANIMNRSESLRFMAACVHLHEELGISEAVGVDLISRMEKNQDNQDSMRMIISESFANLEQYLKENEQIDVAAMMLSGGVVEALYISTQVVDPANPDERIAQLIADQKYSVKSLKELFESYSGDQDLTEYLKDIQSIWKIYETMPEEKAESETKTEGDVLVIGAQKQIKITPEHLTELKSLVTEIRNKYIEP
jgi:hypothetical protein